MHTHATIVHSLQKLSFKNVGWSASYLGDFVDALPSFKSLQTLELSASNFGYEGAVILARGLKAPVCLNVSKERWAHDPVHRSTASMEPRMGPRKVCVIHEYMRVSRKSIVGESHPPLNNRRTGCFLVRLNVRVFWLLPLSSTVREVDGRHCGGAYLQHFLETGIGPARN